MCSILTALVYDSKANPNPQLSVSRHVQSSLCSRYICLLDDVCSVTLLQLMDKKKRNHDAGSRDLFHGESALTQMTDPFIFGTVMPLNVVEMDPKQEFYVDICITISLK